MSQMIHLYALILIIALSGTCLSEIISLRSRALIERPNSPKDYRFHVPIASSPGLSQDDGTDLLDIVLMASVDGKFHALNRKSGQTLWSMSSIPAASVPSSLGPLVRTLHTNSELEPFDDENFNQELYVIEPQSGDIYVMSSPSSPLTRLPFSMSQLVEMSPFIYNGDEGNRVFVGKKETSLMLIELETGRVKSIFDAECPWDPFGDFHEDGSEEVDLDELDGTKPVSVPTEVYIGRTDYHLSISTRALDKFSPRPPVQNLLFSTYGPNNQDNVLQAEYIRTADDAYIQSLPNGEIISFKAEDTSRDRERASRADSQPMWSHNFGSPIVAVFDVLKVPSRMQPIVLLQPSPRLEDVFPKVDFSDAVRLHTFPNWDSAYVGFLHQTGSLFAMSPDRFPLVIFADDMYPPRKHLINGVVSAGEDSKLPSNVDGSTWEDRCREGSGDRRCLTGVRSLEASSRSRFSRLLDGAPVLISPGQGEQVSNSGAVNSDLPSSPDKESNDASVSSNWLRGLTPKPLDHALLIALEGSKGTTPTILSCLLAVLLAILWLLAKKLQGKEVTAQETVAVEQNGAAAFKADIMEKAEVSHAVDAVADEVIASPEPSQPEFPTIPKIDSHSQPPNSINKGHVPEVPHNPISAEDSEREGEKTPVPGKKKGRRGARGGKGRKKKVTVDGDDGDRDEGEDGAAEGSPPPDKDGKEMEDDPTPGGLTFSSSTPRAVSAPSLSVSDTVLGFGSHGTVVFKGSLQGRAVAVKRLLQDFVTLASREVSILQESDDHPNVIRYYYQEAHANFLYIALELCPASLADVIESPDQFRDISNTFNPKRALRQIASGLRHLHALKLIHRDIKPQNILISSAKGGSGRSPGHRMLISDFGLCKKLDVDQTSFLPTAQGAMGAGTVGWRAPEILRGEVKLDDGMGDDHSMSSRGSTSTSTGSNTSGKPTRLTKSVDIFALGCLFYYTLTSGSHPFGDRFEREVNILKNARCLKGLEHFGEEGSEGADLISSMLDPEAHLRPDTTTCLLHPFFWDSAKRLNFLQDASDRFEIMCRDPRDRHLITLEEDAFSIVGNDWHSRLDKVFIENLGKFRKYDGRTLQDLLRALRNKKHHYQDLPDNVKRTLGPMPEGFLAYFTRRFPSLFMHVHTVVAKTGMQRESMFLSYFDLAD